MGDPFTTELYTREGTISDPLHFHSGNESDIICKPTRSPFGIQGSYFRSERSLAAVDKKDKSDKRKVSPKPKRTRKISLFSQFHFNGKSDSKSRKVSAPTISSLVPCSSFPLGYPEDIVPDFSSDSSTSSMQSIQSSLSLPLQLTVDNSSLFSRRKSNNICVTSSVASCEKEKQVLKDIILETLMLQFENVTQYKREICDKLGKNVSELVRRRVEIMKEAKGQSCKVVTLVYVGAVRNNGIDIATQALIENDRDLFTAASYRNGHVFAVATAMVVALDY